MKKFIAILLAALLVVGMTTTAMADPETVSIPVHYTLTNEGTSSPEETFTLNMASVVKAETSEAGVDSTDIPALGEVTPVTLTAGNNGEIKVALPDPAAFPAAGVYSYTGIVEQSGTTAGVTYSTEEIEIRLTVSNAITESNPDGDMVYLAKTVRITKGEGEQAQTYKVGTDDDAFIENVYSAGELDLTKTVAGNLGDTSKYFGFTITLTGEEGKTYQPIAVNKAELSYDGDPANPATITVGTAATIYIRHGETIKLTNIPYDVTYTVVEDGAATSGKNSEGYETEYTFSDPANKIDSEKDTVTVTNTKDETVDTGIVLDTLPFVMIAVAAAAAVVLMSLKKRRVEE